MWARLVPFEGSEGDPGFWRWPVTLGAPWPIDKPPRSLPSPPRDLLSESVSKFPSSNDASHWIRAHFTLA